MLDQKLCNRLHPHKHHVAAISCSRIARVLGGDAGVKIIEVNDICVMYVIHNVI